MAESREAMILKTAKEITVKFIEVGRVSPTNFSEIFKNIHQTVKDAVRGIEEVLEEEED
ncbi:MAG: hypothetical protein JRI76_11960 [Deltaproteobacteria bacterium]|nr:hypothetical protein [Deltaproteobacteria bacterium]MBW1956169.1 hypothetical protein [Deltaproteobacteria bacterium]MBW2042727.1 hypothetical protein [Deltaproteobacteria bacterium]